MKEQVRQLWKLCFSDSDEFVDLYFKMRYTEECNSVIESGGRVVAALQRIPYPMTFGGCVIPTSYISGACTHPDSRNQGLMKRLLVEAHRRMYEEGVMLSTLIPAEEWLKGYYAKSGYAACFQQESKLLTRDACPVNNYSDAWQFGEIGLGKKLPDDVFRLFDSLQHRFECRILHTAHDLQVVMADLRLSGGKLFTVCKDGELEGLCFCLQEKGKLLAQELLCRDELARQALLAFLFRQEGIDEIEVPDLQAESPSFLGMARVIDVRSVLALFARTQTGLYIEVVGDEALPANNGFYNLENGTCTCGCRPDKHYRRVSIEALPHLLFYGQRPYMNLMLN